MKFLHTMIRVSDIEKSLKFYEGFLGLKLSRVLELDDCKLYFLKDAFSDVEIELTHNFETPEGGYEKGTQFGHFAFEVQSFDDVTQKLKECGYEYLYEPFELKPGLKIAFVKDPDGAEIELIESMK